MRRNANRAIEEERPLKQKILAWALTVLMLCDVAPEYGFGLGVRAQAEDPSANAMYDLTISASEAQLWRSGASALNREKYMQRLPGADGSLEAAQAAFDQMTNNGTLIHALEIGGDAATAYMIDKSDGLDVYLYNKNSDKQINVAMSRDYELQSSQAYEVRQSPVTLEAIDEPIIDQVEEPLPVDPDKDVTDPPEQDGEVLPPAGEGETLPPAGNGEAAPPVGDGEAAPPVGDGEAAPPAGDSGAAPPEGDSETAPPEGDSEVAPPEDDGEEMADSEPVQDSDAQSDIVGDVLTSSAALMGQYVMRRQVLSEHVEGAAVAPDAGADLPDAGNAGAGADLPDAENAGAGADSPDAGNLGAADGGILEDGDGEPADMAALALEYVGTNSSVEIATSPGNQISVHGVPVQQGQFVRLSFKVTQPKNPDEFATQWLAGNVNNDYFTKVTVETNAGSGQVMTNQKFTLTPKFYVPQAPVYESGSLANTRLFKQYNTITFTMKLPKELKAALKEHVEGVDLQEQSDGSWIYTYSMSGNNFFTQNKTLPALELQFPIGAAEIIGGSFSLGEASMLATFQPDGSSKEYTITLGQEHINGGAGVPTIKVVGDEKWAISKSIIKGAASGGGSLDYTLDGERVIVRYLVEIGLDNGSGKPIGEGGTYDRVGRTGFDDFSVVETLPTFTNGSGQSIAPTGSKMGLTNDGKTISGTTVNGASGETVLTVNEINYGPKGNLTNLTGEMPFFTKYLVEVTYNKADFTVQADEFEQSQDDGKFALSATATMNYKPKGGAGTSVSAKADTRILFARGGGTLKIEKLIKELGKDLPFNFETSQSYPGSATFEITPKAGSSLPGGFVQPSITPTNASPNNFVTVSLRPGEYTIKETAAPDGTSVDSKTYDFTITEGTEAAVTFVNQTNGRGGAKFYKFAAETPDKKLGGATFRLSGTVNGQPYEKTATSLSAGDIGLVEFTGIPAGVYTLTEAFAPADYAPWTGSVEVTIAPDKVTEVTGVPANVKTEQTLTINKKIVVPGGTTENARSAAASEKEKFSFQVLDAADGLVKTAKLDNTGKATVTLKAFDTDGNPISYKIREVITNDTATTYYQYDSTVGVIKDLEVPAYDVTRPWETTVYNTYGGSVKMEKRTATMSLIYETFKFHLMELIDGKLVQVPNASFDVRFIGEERNKVTVPGLNVNGKYYWYEEPLTLPSGISSTMVGVNNQPAEIIDGKQVISAGQPTLSPTPVVIHNIADKAQIILVKKDADNTSIPLKGAKFEIWTDAGADSKKVAEGVTAQNGTIEVVLAPGKYYAKEITPPNGYMIMEEPYRFEVVTRQENNITFPKDASFEIYNTKNAGKLTITKTITNWPNGVKLTSPIHFELYTKVGNTYTRAKKSNGADMERIAMSFNQQGSSLTASKVLTDLPIKDSQNKEIFYALKEVATKHANGLVDVIPQTGYIDVGVITQAGVTKEVTNPANWGKLRVQKYVEGTTTPLANATISFVGGQTGAEGTRTVQTNAQGIAEVKVPVFDVNAEGIQGARYAYTITETKAPVGFTPTDTKFETTAALGEITDVVRGTDGAATGQPLVFYNGQSRTIVGKKVQKAWGDSVNSGNVPDVALAGAVIGLYEKQADGSYTLMDQQTSNTQGQVTFKGTTEKPIKSGASYRLVEIAAPAGYTLPDGKILASNGGNALPTISATDIEKYNATADLSFGAGEAIKWADALVNNLPWAQFKLLKVSDDEAGTPLDGATFAFYRQATGGSTNVIYNRDGAEFIEYYTSGFSLGAENKLQAGLILTRAVGAGDIYYLTETFAPNGHELGTETTVAFVPEGTTLTGAPSTVKVVSYNPGAVTDGGNIVNPVDSGAGGGKFAYTGIALDKILRENGKPDVPLADVTFELYLANQSGTTKVRKIGEAVTGKDTLTGGGIGRAFFGPINLEALFNEFGGKDAPTNPIVQEIGKVSADAAEPTYIAKFILVEKSAPAGIIPAAEERSFTMNTATRTGSDLTTNDVMVKDRSVLIDISNTDSGSKGAIINTKQAGKVKLNVWKYGYDMAPAFANKTDEELDRLLSTTQRRPIDQARFKLEKYNVLGQKWEQVGAEFTTNAQGFATVMIDAQQQYRVVELNSANVGLSNDLMYLNKHTEALVPVFAPGPNDTEYALKYFNPAKPLVRVVKNDGKITSGIDFSLGSTKMTAPAGGKEWTLNVGAGEYTLSEKVTDESIGLSDANLPENKIIVSEDGALSLIGADGRIELRDGVFYVTNPYKGTLTVKKTDGANPLRANVEFEMRYLPTSDSQPANEAFEAAGVTTRTITVTNGEWSEKVNPGWYYLKETKAPEGYTLDVTPQIIKVTGEATATLTFKNAAEGKLVFTKSFNDTLLEGNTQKVAVPTAMEVLLYPANADGSGPDTTKAIPTGSISVNSKTGKLELPLDAGTYFLKEKLSDADAPWWILDTVTGGEKAENGYIKFTVTSAQSATVNMTNVPNVARIEITKVDQETQTPIKGVVFELKQGDAAPQTLTTDENGKVSYLVQNPEQGGAISLVEKSAPAEYEKPDETKNLLEGETIHRGAVIRKTVTNKKGMVINVTKYEGTPSSSKPLAGIKLQLLDKDGNVLQNAQTDAEGKAAFVGLLQGAYQISEPAEQDAQYLNYVLEAVTINGNSATAVEGKKNVFALGELTQATNEAALYNRKPQTLTITKQELGNLSNTNALAKYKIYAVESMEAQTTEGAQLIHTTPTLAHEVKVPLQPGIYLVEEIETNLMLNDADPRTPTKKTVTIKSGEDASLIFQNAARFAALEPKLTKTASPEEVEGNLVEGDQKLDFTLDGFATGTNEMSFDSATLTDVGLGFYSDSPGTKLANVQPEYVFNTITVGQATYETFDAQGEKTIANDMQVELFVDDTSQGTRAIGGGAATFNVTEPGKSFRLVYTTQGAKPIGPHFNAGAVEISVTAKKIVGTEAIKAPDLVLSAKNTAEYFVTQSGASSKKAQAFAWVRFSFDGTLAKMMLSKDVILPEDKGGALAIGSVIRYELKLTNTSEKTVSQPVILDVLPKGVTLVGDYNVTGPTSKITNFAVNGQQGIKFAFTGKEDGKLDPGASITITYEVKVTTEALLTGETDLKNRAYATSLYRIAGYAGNELGMSFAPPDGGNLVTEKPGEETVDYISVLNGVLNAEGGKGFGYLTSSVSRTVKAEAELYGQLALIVKGEHITSDTQNGKIGTTEEYQYEMNLFNNSRTAHKGIRLGNLLPKFDDRRDSRWDVRMAENPQITVAADGVSTSDVKISYGSDAIADDVHKNTGNSKFTGSAEAASATSIYVAFPPEYELAPGKGLTVTFTVKPKPFENANNIPLYTLASDTFAYSYTGEVGTSTSNVVSVELSPESVSVGGFVWIDEDKDGFATTQERANLDWKAAFEASGTEIVLTEYRGKTKTEYRAKGIGEDGAFKFDGLTPAELSGVGNVQNDNYTLNLASLKGTTPTYYTLEMVNAPDGFALTKPHGGNKSFSHSIPANGLSGQAKVASHLLTDTARSEEFFLYSEASGMDLTKNIGLTKTGGLTVQKKDTTGAAIEGAEFTLYGPFTQMPDVGSYQSGGNVTGKTDNHGKLSFDTLSGYQYHVLEETAAATGFTLEGATVTGGGFTKLEGKSAWLFRPAGQNLTVTIENQRVDTSLRVRKSIAEGQYVGDEVFTFELQLDNKGTGSFERYTLKAEQLSGSVGVINADGRLELKANQEATLIGLPSNVKYQVIELTPPAGFSQESTVYEPGGSQTLVANTGDLIANGVTITNVNNTQGTVTLTAKKVLDGQALKASQFTFTLTGNGQNQTAVNTAEGLVTFQPITYQMSDVGKTYEYTIREVTAQGDLKGITYDQTAHVVKVEVTKNDAGEILTTVVYGENIIPQDGIIFRNKYDAQAQLVLGAKKILEGGILQADQFEFTLTGDSQNQTAKNDAQGNVTFAPIIYTLAELAGAESKSYTYTVREVKGNAYGVTYDEGYYTVNVTVSDKGDGTLDVVATMNDVAFRAEDARFNNRMQALAFDLYKHLYNNVNNSINGAGFRLYNYNEANSPTYIGTEVAGAYGTTSNGGWLRFEKLLPGKYVLVETYVPSGYEAVRSRYTLDISMGQNGNTVVNLLDSGGYGSVTSGSGGPVVNIPNLRRRTPTTPDDPDPYDPYDPYDPDPDNPRLNERTPLTRTPLTEIPDEGVPLAFPPDNPLVEIPDEDVPLGALPNTGGFPVGAFAIMGGLMALLGIKIKKGKKDKS